MTFPAEFMTNEVTSSELEPYLPEPEMAPSAPSTPVSPANFGDPLLAHFPAGKGPPPVGSTNPSTLADFEGAAPAPSQPTEPTAVVVVNLFEETSPAEEIIPIQVMPTSEVATHTAAEPIVPTAEAPPVAPPSGSTILMSPESNYISRMAGTLLPTTPGPSTAGPPPPVEEASEPTTVTYEQLPAPTTKIPLVEENGEGVSSSTPAPQATSEVATTTTQGISPTMAPTTHGEPLVHILKDVTEETTDNLTHAGNHTVTKPSIVSGATFLNEIFRVWFSLPIY